MGGGVSHAGGVARGLRRGNRDPAPPRLWLFSDPERLADPISALDRLPAGAGVVYRHFGAPDRAANAARLLAACRRRRLVLLIGADWRLAATIRADGVHLPARLAHRAAGLKRSRPCWLISAAGHDRRGVLAAADADLVFLSPVLATRSASARATLGLQRAGAMARAAGRPVIALGGVGPADWPALRARGFYGLAGVDWALEPPPI
jgi:thiamine-phosphate pyrophosphorylase